MLPAFLSDIWLLRRERERVCRGAAGPGVEQSSGKEVGVASGKGQWRAEERMMPWGRAEGRAQLCCWEEGRSCHVGGELIMLQTPAMLLLGLSSPQQMF